MAQRMSRLTQARGLKLRRRGFNRRHAHVAPHAGAWIETEINWLRIPDTDVAPHAGAWIETIDTAPAVLRTPVAPHAGAWIETTPTLAGLCSRVASRLTQARGLKLADVGGWVSSAYVAPHAGAWIETWIRPQQYVFNAVAPHAG